MNDVTKVTNAIEKTLNLTFSAGKEDHPTTEWARWLVEHLGVPIEEPSETSLENVIAGINRKLSGTARATKDGSLQAALVELQSNIEDRVTLQKFLNYPSTPVLEDLELWSAIYTELFDEDSMNLSLQEMVFECLRQVTNIKAISEMSEYVNSPIHASKLAYKEINSFFDRRQQSDDKPEPQANDDDVEFETSESVTADLISAKIDGRPLNKHLPTLISYIDEGDLQLNPPWQRGDVWSLAKKRSLIESLLLGVPLPSIILHIEEKNDDRGKITVIDGKQRLTAIHQYFKGEWSLGKYSKDTSLHEVSGKEWSDLPRWAARKIADTQVPVLEFTGLEPGVLYRIFELYNVSGTRLNAVEIRNAVFHANPIHRMAFALAGEGDDESIYLEKREDQVALTALLRATVSPTGQPKRYSTLDFLCRYLAYSRAPVAKKTGVFVADSTAKTVRMYFETLALKESPHEVAKEINEVFDFAIDIFHNSGADPFSISTNGIRRFNRLRATTSLVLAKIALVIKERCHVTDPDIAGAVKHTVEKIPYPNKQQTSAIWKFQADNVIEFLSYLSISSEHLVDTPVSRLVETMKAISGK